MSSPPCTNPTERRQRRIALLSPLLKAIIPWLALRSPVSYSLVALCCACVSAEGSFDHPVAMKSLLVARGRQTGLAIEAIDLTESPRAFFESESETEVELLYSRSDLASLLLYPGALARAPDGQPSRPLPPMELVFGVEGSERVPKVAPSEAVRTFRVAGDAFDECGRRGRCIDGPSCVSECFDGVIAPSPPEAPELPAPPDFSMGCPAGWTPEPGRACLPPTVNDCAEGEFAFVGGCARPADPCGIEPFGRVPTVDVRFVDASASPGGDGSRATPFESLERALLETPDGFTLAVGRWVANEPVTISRPITILGACPEATRFGSMTFAANATVARASVDTLSVQSGHARIADSVLGRTRSSHDEYDVLVRGDLDLAHSAVKGSGIDVSFGSLTISDVAISEVPGIALSLAYSDVQIEGLRARNTGGAVTFDSTVLVSELVLEGTYVDRTLPHSSDVNRCGFCAISSTVAMRFAVLDGDPTIDIVLAAYYSKLDLESVHVASENRNAISFGTGARGSVRKVSAVGGSAMSMVESSVLLEDGAFEGTVGIELHRGADLLGARVRAQATHIGVAAADPSSTRPTRLELTDADLLASSPTVGYALFAGSRSALAPVSVLARRVHVTAPIQVDGPNASLVLEDWTSERSERPHAVTSHASARITRARISDSGREALATVEAQLDASDLAISRNSSADECWPAIEITARSTATLERLRIEDSRGTSIRARGNQLGPAESGARVVLRDVDIVGGLGRAVEITNFATADLERVRAIGLHGQGLASGRYSNLSVVDAEISGGSAQPTCLGEASRSGLLLTSSQLATVKRFLITGDFDSAVRLAPGAIATLEEGRIDGPEVGLLIEGTATNPDQTLLGVEIVNTTNAVRRE